jgi:hypothetical protein
MILGVEEAACTILESLAQHLPESAVDYECFNGMHHFFIEQSGARFRVWFPETALMGKGPADLQPAIRRITAHVLGHNRPLQFKQASVMYTPATGVSGKSRAPQVVSDSTLPLSRT